MAIRSIEAMTRINGLDHCYCGRIMDEPGGLPGFCSQCEGVTELRSYPVDFEKALDAKIKSTIQYHAERQRISTPSFREVFGWSLDAMRALLNNTYHYGNCPYCHTQFLMHPLSEMSIDVVNVNLAPYLQTNTIICCLQCNRQKATLTPERWGQIVAKRFKPKAKQASLFK